MSGKSCSDCHYFAEFKVETCPYPYKVDVNQYRLGFCHRYPPSALEFRPNSVPPVVATFPTVKPDEWCGEFKQGSGRPAAAPAAAASSDPFGDDDGPEQL